MLISIKTTDTSILYTANKNFVIFNLDMEFDPICIRTEATIYSIYMIYMSIRDAKRSYEYGRCYTFPGHYYSYSPFELFKYGCYLKNKQWNDFILDYKSLESSPIIPIELYFK